MGFGGTGSGFCRLLGVVALIAVASPAAAQLDYAVPCLSKEGFAELLRPLLPDGADVEPAADGFSVRIVPDGSGFLLDVRQGSEDEFVRQLHDGSCRELARAAAQIIALTVADAPPPIAAGGARLLASGGLPPAAAAAEQPLVIGVELSVLTAAGVVPGLGLGTGTRAFFDHESLSFTLGFRYWWSQLQAQGAGLPRLRVSIFEAVLGVTWRALHGKAWTVGPKLELSSGAWIAQVGSNSAASSWLAHSALGVAFALEASPRVHVELSVAGVVPWSRPGSIGADGTRRFRPAVLGLEAGFTVRFVGYP